MIVGECSLKMIGLIIAVYQLILFDILFFVASSSSVPTIAVSSIALAVRARLSISPVLSSTAK